LKSNVIVFDVLACTPHTETSIELAILESLAGSSVHYVPIYVCLPDSIWNGPVNGDPANSRTADAWLAYTSNILGRLADVVYVRNENLPWHLIFEQRNEASYTQLELESAVRNWPLPIFPPPPRHSGTLDEYIPYYEA